MEKIIDLNPMILD